MVNIVGRIYYIYIADLQIEDLGYGGAEPGRQFVVASLCVGPFFEEPDVGVEVFEHAPMPVHSLSPLGQTWTNFIVSMSARVGWR